MLWDLGKGRLESCWVSDWFLTQITGSGSGYEGVVCLLLWEERGKSGGLYRSLGTVIGLFGGVDSFLWCIREVRFRMMWRRGFRNCPPQLNAQWYLTPIIAFTILHPQHSSPPKKLPQKTEINPALPPPSSLIIKSPLRENHCFTTHL